MGGGGGGLGRGAAGAHAFLNGVFGVPSHPLFSSAAHKQLSHGLSAHAGHPTPSYSNLKEKASAAAASQRTRFFFFV